MQSRYLVGRMADCAGFEAPGYCWVEDLLFIRRANRLADATLPAGFQDLDIVGWG